MKQTVEKRKPSGFVDYVALTLTTWGVGYGPIAPGTWGSMVGVLIYIGIVQLVASIIAHFSMFSSPVWPFLAEYPTTALPMQVTAWIYVGIAVTLVLFCLLGIWASGRSISLLGDNDPSEAVVDEVMGQLITFCFVPFGIGWPFILAGFLLFRFFDIWKPYPIDALQVLPGGIGVCADDIVAGVYAGVCLAIGYAVFLSI
ncbi:MAG: phosphatidylglycerophosphatase A [Pyrinomonadaceae bacterium]|nr:phosphatidylglycerophosphatase A [Pyrinomonadaceae bacterium]MBP6214326.1 phosphatidylglycerophosphatase A [Pyrinomonadaceae bacterium]